MKRTIYLAMVFAVVIVSCPTKRTMADLIINLNFANFNTAAPADGSAILGGSTKSAAQNVIQTAANYWTNAFANSNSSRSFATGGRITQNISVGWQSHAGSTLATGGTSFFGSGEFAGGSLNFDNDGSSNFYVDSNPGNNSEWLQSSQRSMSFNGVNMNVERVHFDASGLARTNNDLLSVSIHEIGHALGFLSGYPGFSGTITSGAFNGALIPTVGGHTSFQILSPNGQFPFNPGGGGFFNQFQYNPNVMGPSLVTGVRTTLTEADIAIMAQTLGFDMATVNFNPTAVPEPSSIMFVAISLLGLGMVAKRRSKRIV